MTHMYSHMIKSFIVVFSNNLQTVANQMIFDKQESIPDDAYRLLQWPLGVVCFRGVSDRHPPCEQNDWQTGLKTKTDATNIYLCFILNFKPVLR